MIEQPEVTQCPICEGSAYVLDWGIECENCGEVDNSIVEQVADLRLAYESLVKKIEMKQKKLPYTGDNWFEGI